MEVKPLIEKSELFKRREASGHLIPQYDNSEPARQTFWYINWALDEMEDAGYIGYDPILQTYVRRELPIPFTRTTIPEPGRKVRVVTMAPESVTLFLQPFGHQMVEFLKMEPCINAGLTRGY